MADEAAAYSPDDAAWLDESGKNSVLEEELSPGDGGNPDSVPGGGFISTTSGMGRNGLWNLMRMDATLFIWSARRTDV